MVIISMIVVCNGINTVEYDRKNPELSSAPLHINYDNNRDHTQIYNHSSKIQTKPDIT